MAETAWVTGAGKGIGRALALVLATEGWHVAASARTGDDLESLAAEARQAGGTVSVWPLDVTDEQATAETVAAIEAAFGPIVLAVLNAGTHLPVSAHAFKTDAFRTLMGVNVLGAVYGLGALLPRLIERGRGRIAVVASVAGYRGLPTSAAYGASKAALINLCEALRPELQESGVTLQVINPGFVRTPLTDRNTFPMPFLIEPEAAARQILRGLKSRRFEIAFPWQLVWILKILRVLPDGLYFRIVKRMLPE